MKGLIVLLLGLATAANAADKADDKLGLHHESEVGYIVVGGNTKSESFSGKQATWYQWDMDLAKFSASYLNSEGEVDGENRRTAENWNLGLRWEHIIEKKVFNTYLETTLMKDHFRGIDLGNSYGLGAKYFWISSKTVKFFSELGYQYLKEDLDPIAPSTTGTTLESHFLRVFSQVDYEHTKSMKIGLWVEYLPDLKEEDNYRVNFSPYLLAILDDVFSLKFGYQGQYRNIPAAGNTQRLDFQHTTALIAKF